MNQQSNNKCPKIIITRFPFQSQLGGEEWHSHQLFSYLAKNKQVQYEFYGSCPVLGKLFKSKTVWMPRSPVSKLSLLIYILLSPYVALRFFYKAWRLSKSHCLVYMHSLSEKILLAPFLRLFNIPYVFVEHARIGNWLLRNPLLPIYKKNLNFKRSKLISVSELMATALRGLKVEIIPNAIQTAFLKTANPKSGNKILYIGRLTADKGVDKILESALQLPNFKFIMVGSGPLKTQLKSAGLKVYDKMSHRKIMDLLLKVDLLLLPASQVDPFGLTVLEAMSRNVPALISDKVGISSYLNHGKNVFVIADSLTSSIQNIFADQKKLQFVISHLEPTYRKFKYAKMADSYWKIFQRL